MNNSQSIHLFTPSFPYREVYGQSFWSPYTYKVQPPYCCVVMFFSFSCVLVGYCVDMCECQCVCVKVFVVLCSEPDCRLRLLSSSSCLFCFSLKSSSFWCKSIFFSFFWFFVLAIFGTVFTQFFVLLFRFSVLNFIIIMRILIGR